MPTIEFRVDVTGIPPHSFIIINNGAGFEQGYGFKPAEKFDPMGPGHVYIDTDAPYDFTTGPIQVTNEQYNAIVNKINESIQNRGCKKFCVNGHLTGNCRYFERSRNDRSKSTTERPDRQPVSWL